MALRPGGRTKFVICDLSFVIGPSFKRGSPRIETVRLGIIGIGSMGSIHAQNVMEGKIPRCELTAVCDRNPERMQRFSSAQAFDSADEFLRRSETDAVLIATPHYAHTTIGIKALESGRHVLVEKPISAHKADAERLFAAHRRPDQVFDAMFNPRTAPFFLKLRRLVKTGELGAIRRSEEHTSELQSHLNLVCRLLLEKKNNTINTN